MQTVMRCHSAALLLLTALVASAPTTAEDAGVATPGVATPGVATPGVATPGAATPEARLQAAGFSLPDPTRPMAAYVTWRRSGNLLYLSGHGECGADFTRGKVGKDLTMEEGKAVAEGVGLCMLATMKSALGELSRVKQVLRIDGMVNATPDFGHQPEVINGFSELLVVAFGEAGLGARAAVGMASLPRNIPVEISAIVEVHP